MKRYRLSQRARRDILDIWNYIADDSERSADAFIDRVTAQLELLGRNPYLGKRRDDLQSECRSFPINEYLIFYEVRKPRIEVIRIVHGRRDIKRATLEE